MRVCHVTSVHPPFDVRIFHKECRTLAQAGCDVTLLAQADWSERIVDGVRIIGLPTITNRHERVRLWRFIIKEVGALGPDFIHFHDPELLLIIPFLRPAKLIYDCHEPNAETMLVRHWIPHMLRYPVSRLVAFLEPILARRVDAIVVTEDSHVKLFQKRGRPVVLLYNYPLLSEVDPSCHGDGKTVLHVGVLSEGRGAGTMIEAMRQVVQRIPGARLVLVGGCDYPEYEAELRRLITAYGLGDAVKLVGWVPFTNLPKWFVLADVGLVPWHAREEFPPPVIPTKLFEYMCYRLPVVASNLPVTRRFTGGLECGLLVEPGDSLGFAEAIVYLLDHPAEAKRMGERGRRAIEKVYHWETEGKKLVALYRQLA